MRGAYGKPTGTCARVKIDQIIASVRAKDAVLPVALEAFRRAKGKLPGRQYVVVSKKWGFTKFNRDEYAKLKSEGKVIPDGCYVKLSRTHGPIYA